MSESTQLVSPRFVDRLEDCFFYHAMELPGFGLVRGHWDLRGRFDDYVGGVPMAGKSVLDVGAATGFLSFEAEKKGASRVLSFDQKDGAQQTFLPFKDKPYFRDPERWAAQYGAEIEQWKNAYWLCHRLLDSKADVYYGDVYHLPETLGQVSGRHRRFRARALERSRSARWLRSRGSSRRRLSSSRRCSRARSPIARFEGRADNPDADFTWWTYSPAVYREVFAMLGFSIAKISHAKFYYMYGDRFEERSTIVAVRS